MRHNLRGRLDRLDRRTMPNKCEVDGAVIRAVLSDKEPAELRAALLALPPGDMRDHFLSDMDEDGEWLPRERPPEWVPPGPPSRVGYHWSYTECDPT